MLVFFIVLSTVQQSRASGIARCGLHATVAINWRTSRSAGARKAVENCQRLQFLFGCFFQVIIALELFGPARANALSVSQKQGNIYMIGLLYLIIIWTVYPIVWALECGTHVMTPNVAAFVYAVLDFLAKPCFSALLYYLHTQLEESSDADGSTREGLLECASCVLLLTSAAVKRGVYGLQVSWAACASARKGLCTCRKWSSQCLHVHTSTL